MTPKELTERTVEDIIIRRLKEENDFCGYESDEIKRKRNWSISLGGYRW